MDDWQHRIDAVWDAAADAGEEATVQRIDALVAERPADDPVALFEAAGARDYAGREADAEPLYRASIAGGLAEPQRAQAVIQLASTLRNLGRLRESVELLRAELAAHPEHELSDAARAFLALACTTWAGTPTPSRSPSAPSPRTCSATDARSRTTRTSCRSGSVKLDSA